MDSAREMRCVRDVVMWFFNLSRERCARKTVAYAGSRLLHCGCAWSKWFEQRFVLRLNCSSSPYSSSTLRGSLAAFSAYLK